VSVGGLEAEGVADVAWPWFGLIHAVWPGIALQLLGEDRDGLVAGGVSGLRLRRHGGTSMSGDLLGGCSLLRDSFGSGR